MLDAPFQQVFFFARMANQIRLEEMVTEARASAAAWDGDAYKDLVKDAYGIELSDKKKKRRAEPGQSEAFVRELGDAKEHLKVVDDGSLRAKLAARAAAAAEKD